MSMIKADTLYLNGKIYTVDDNDSRAEALAVKDNKIVFVGSNEEAGNTVEADNIVNLDGKMMLPGFIEGHGHPTIASIDSVFKVDLFNGESVDDYLTRIKKFVAENPDLPAYEGAGWENPFFGAQGPSRKLLDEICDDRPMLMASHDKHSVWVNTYVLEMCGVDENTTVPQGCVIEREDDGKPSGTLREWAAMELVAKAQPVYNKDNYKEAFKWVQKFYASLGVTALLDALINPAGDAMAALQELSDNNELIFKVRGAFQTPDDDPFKYVDLMKEITARNTGDMFKMDQVKAFTDGVIEGRTAYLKEEYSDEPGFYGEPIWTKDELFELVCTYDKLGYDLHFHTIGDAATAMMLDAYDYAEAHNPHRNRRPVCTHLQVVDPADYERIKKHGFIAVTNPYWHFKYRGFYDGIEEPYLGERAYKEYPLKSLIDAGINIGGASDYNVTPIPAPLRGIQVGVTRVGIDEDPDDKDLVLNPAEKADLPEMIRAFTMGNAMALKIEDITGSLEPGKHADMVILEKDIFDVAPADIYKVKVLQTISEGKVIYDASDDE